MQDMTFQVFHTGAKANLNAKTASGNPPGNKQAMQ